MLPDLIDDPRFAAALAHFADSDWLEASDLFEELFFESVRDELPIVRALLQISTGMHHISRRQRRPAIERLEEGLRILDAVTNAHGVELESVRAIAVNAIRELKQLV